MQQRDELRTSVANGKDFFYKYAKSGDGKLLGDGAQRMLEIIQRIADIESEIKRMDTLIISNLEMEINQVNFKFVIPQHPNDAGDIIQSTEYFVTNEDTSRENSLDINDLWTIILLKEMFDVKNVELIPKEKGGE
jgi:hypothetical protein